MTGCILQFGKSQQIEYKKIIRRIKIVNVHVLGHIRIRDLNLSSIKNSVLFVVVLMFYFLDPMNIGTDFILTGTI